MLFLFILVMKLRIFFIYITVVIVKRTYVCIIVHSLYRTIILESMHQSVLFLFLLATAKFCCIKDIDNKKQYCKRSYFRLSFWMMRHRSTISVITFRLRY